MDTIYQNIAGYMHLPVYVWLCMCLYVCTRVCVLAFAVPAP